MPNLVYKFTHSFISVITKVTTISVIISNRNMFDDDWRNKKCNFLITFTLYLRIQLIKSLYYKFEYFRFILPLIWKHCLWDEFFLKYCWKKIIIKQGTFQYHQGDNEKRFRFFISLLSNLLFKISIYTVKFFVFISPDYSFFSFENVSLFFW